MLYFDTSFLVPLVFRESTSAAVERFLSRQAVGTLAVSHWTRVEFSSALAREVRMGALGRADLVKADAQFEAMIAESFEVLLPQSVDFDLAKSFLARPKTGLRAGDALHLAIAANHRAEIILSLDQTLLKAGRALGLPVSAGIRVAR
jgi:predicted nucleic acid-binding protein